MAQESIGQAETLLVKRFHEVGKRLPRTFRSLGDEGERTFRAYAGRSWPQGHDRHLTDAVAFGEFLLREGIPGVSRWELGRVRFELDRSRWSVRWVIDTPSGPGLQILWRARNGDVRAASIGFAFPRFRSPTRGATT